MAHNRGIGIPDALISHYGHTVNGKAPGALFSPGDGLGADDLLDALQRSAGDPRRSRALVISLPFCPVRCLNCDNDAVITHDRRRIDQYLGRMAREMKMLVDAVGYRPRLQQLHQAGGSPNYLDELQLAALMSVVQEHFLIDDATDMSLDANPKRTSATQLQLLRGLGFDRISFGIRELDAAVQLAIGRTSSPEMVRDVFETARDAGFTTIGTDIVYGLPCQTSDGIRRTLDVLLSLAPDRIACYPFSRHAASRVHQSALAHCMMPSLADKMALFNDVVEALSDDYEWIGIDSFALPDDDLSRAQAENRLHRSWLGYSHLPNAETHGMGTSAITDLDNICVQNHTTIEHWSEAIDDNRFAVRGGTRLDPDQRAQRDAVRALMCNQTLTGISALFRDSEVAAAQWDAFEREGLVTITGDSLRMTEAGRYALPHLLTH